MTASERSAPAGAAPLPSGTGSRAGAFARARPARRDVGIAAALTLAAVVEHAVSDPAHAVALGSVLACVAVAWRRVAPVATCLVVMVLVGLPEFLVGSTSDWFSGFAAVVLALYTLAAYAAPARLVPGIGAAAVLICAVSVQAGLNDDSAPVTDAVSGGVLFALVIIGAPALIVGLSARRYFALQQRLAEQVAALDAERELHARAAADSERSRVADDLHDAVASAVEAMLGAVRDARAAVTADPATAAPVIQRLEDRGRDALTEMRSLLGVLRRGDEDLALAPMPSLTRLDALARRRSCGLRVEGAPRAVSPGLDVAAYRVVETALDRASTAEHTDIVLRWTPRGVEVEVGADGPELARVDDALGELVALFDGRLSAERRPGGGSALRAALPTEATT